jgi:hypothetical protein
VLKLKKELKINQRNNMKVLYLVLISFSVISCGYFDDHETEAPIHTSPTNKVEEVVPPAVEVTQDKYDWGSLLLTTGYVNDVKELSDFQSSQLELIKFNFPKIEALAFDQAQKVYADFYNDSILSDSLYVSGVHIFNDTTEIIEFYFQSENIDRTLVPVILFKKFKLLGTTYID